MNVRLVWKAVADRLQTRVMDGAKIQETSQRRVNDEVCLSLVINLSWESTMKRQERHRNRV